MNLILTLTLKPHVASPLSVFGLSFDLDLHNAGSEALEFPEPSGWDLDLPAELSHSSDSQGELWIRRVGAPDPKAQRYSCSDCEPNLEPPLRLEPDAHREVCVPAPALPPGQYEVRVRLYTPEVSSNTLRLTVGPA